MLVVVGFFSEENNKVIGFVITYGKVESYIQLVFGIIVAKTVIPSHNIDILDILLGSVTILEKYTLIADAEVSEPGLLNDIVYWVLAPAFMFNILRVMLVITPGNTDSPKFPFIFMYPYDYISI